MTPNRAVALLTPIVFAPLAGALSAWVATHFPGVEMPADQVQAVFIAGALIAFGKAAQWLNGWQKYEVREAGSESAALALDDARGRSSRRGWPRSRTPAGRRNRRGAFDEEADSRRHRRRDQRRGRRPRGAVRRRGCGDAQAATARRRHRRPGHHRRRGRRTGLRLAMACALLEKESSGGRNVFGHDPSIFAGAGEVTRDRYAAYKRARDAGCHAADAGRRPLPADLVGAPGPGRPRGRLLASRDQHARRLPPPRRADQGLRRGERDPPLQRQRRGGGGLQPRPDGARAPLGGRLDGADRGAPPAAAAPRARTDGRPHRRSPP